MTSIPDDIQAELTNIGNSTAAIRNALVAKGVTPTGGLSSYADAISSISGGGASSNCFPSGTYETLTLGASGATYTAPADGWFMFYIDTTETTGSCTYIAKNLTRNSFGSSGDFIISQYRNVDRNFLPVLANDDVMVDYRNTGAFLYMRFYYTIDSAPQQAQT